MRCGDVIVTVAVSANVTAAPEGRPFLFTYQLLLWSTLMVGSLPAIRL
jgi:hypothetical protein